MKKLITLLLFSLISTFTFASNPVTFLQIGAPGANSELYSNLMSSRLSDKGWDTSLLNFPDCKGAEEWVKRNPQKPVIFMTWSDDFVLPMIQPENARSCPALTISEKTLVTVINKSHHMVCSRGDLGLTEFMSSKPAKVGIWNHPVQTQVAKDLIKDLKLEHKIVGFARGADLMQALVSSDVDYIVVSSENLIRGIGGQCFLTTASPALAKTMSNLKTNQMQTSVQSLGFKLSRSGTGLIPLYVSYNTDIARLRVDIADILNTSPEYNKLWTSINQKSGIVAGQTPAEQWTDFSSFLNSFKK